MSTDNNDYNGFDTDSDQKSNTTKLLLIGFVALFIIAILAVVAFFLLKPHFTGDSSSESVSEASTARTESSAVSDAVNESEVSSAISETASSEDYSATESTVSIENSETPETSEVSESSESSEAAVEHGFVINAMGYTYLYYENGYQQFNGTTKSATRYAESVNALAAALPGKRFFSGIAPTSVEFAEIPRDIYTADNFYNSSQKKNIAAAEAAYSENVRAFDIYTAIEESEDGAYNYFRTDKNWTVNAAYLAYTKFMGASGYAPVPLSSYTLCKYDEFLGSFYNATASKLLGEKPDSVEYYDISAVYPCDVTMYNGTLAYKGRGLIYKTISSPISYGYYAFLGGYGDSFTISSPNAANDSSVLVVGDASAFPFVPFLAANYKNIYFINIEQFKGKISEYIADKNVNDVVVLSYATNTADPSYCTRISDLAN